jgi:hypothetical protein
VAFVHFPTCVLPASRSAREEETIAERNMDLSTFMDTLLEEQDGRHPAGGDPALLGGFDGERGFRRDRR